MGHSTIEVNISVMTLAVSWCRNSVLKGTTKLAGISRLTEKSATQGDFDVDYDLIRFGVASAYHLETLTIWDKISPVGMKYRRGEARLLVFHHNPHQSRPALPTFPYNTVWCQTFIKVGFFLEKIQRKRPERFRTIFFFISFLLQKWEYF